MSIPLYIIDLIYFGLGYVSTFFLYMFSVWNVAQTVTKALSCIWF